MKQSKQSFMTKILAKTEFDVFNGMGMLKLDNGLVAKCIIVDSNAVDKFIALEVTIMNARAAKTDRVLFKFNEHLVKLDDKEGNFFVDASVNWDWYSVEPTPTSIHKICNDINRYIHYFI